MSGISFNVTLFCHTEVKSCPEYRVPQYSKILSSSGETSIVCLEHLDSSQMEATHGT